MVAVNARTSQSDAAPPPRRWLQFRLRTALWLLLVCALGLGWWSDRQRLAEENRRGELLREALKMSIDSGLFDGSVSRRGGRVRVFWEAVEDHATVEPLERYGLESNTQFLLQALAAAQKPAANGAGDLRMPTFQTRMEELLDILSEPDSERRARAARTLALPAYRDRMAVPALIRALDDRQRVVRWHAVYALGQFGRDAKVAAPRLREMVNDKTCEMSAFAAQMLILIDPAADIGPRLVAVLDDERADTRRRAALALAASSRPVERAGIERLLALLTDEDPQVRLAACRAVARQVPREAALDALLAAFQVEQDEITRSRMALEFDPAGWESGLASSWGPLALPVLRGIAGQHWQRQWHTLFTAFFAAARRAH